MESKGVSVGTGLFGERSRSIQTLRAFITGFEVAQPPSDACGNLNLFTEWVATHYRVLADGMASFDMILAHVDGDDRKAYDEFFRLLPHFFRDKQDLGRDGILSKFCDVQDECMEAFKKAKEDQDG